MPKSPKSMLRIFIFRVLIDYIFAEKKTQAQPSILISFERVVVIEQDREDMVSAASGTATKEI